MKLLQAFALLCLPALASMFCLPPPATRRLVRQNSRTLSRWWAMQTTKKEELDRYFAEKLYNRAAALVSTPNKDQVDPKEVRKTKSELRRRKHELLTELSDVKVFYERLSQPVSKAHKKELVPKEVKTTDFIEGALSVFSFYFYYNLIDAIDILFHTLTAPTSADEDSRESRAERSRYHSYATPFDGLEDWEYELAWKQYYTSLRKSIIIDDDESLQLNREESVIEATTSSFSGNGTIIM
mmetsp:Transcript_41989/g.72338  ORF Transcript_41989/g.72338 Transcript_41989/m.72338 type:complete len:240 (+) Transcript_41989:64-783(+)